MSITITTDVFCDLCGDWTHGAVGVKILAKEARRASLRAGWTNRGGKDICPNCNGNQKFVHPDTSYVSWLAAKGNLFITTAGVKQPD